MIYPFPQIIRRKQPIEKVCDKIKSFHNNHLNPTNQSLIQIFTAEVLIFKLQAESWSCTAFSTFYCSMKAYVRI